jgi:phage tail sheath protein FI
MGREPEIGLLCVPDLQWRWQGGSVDPEPVEPPDMCAPPWAQIAPPVHYALPPAPAARLVASDPVQFGELLARQRRCVEVAELRRRFVVLLDVPGGLAAPDIARWRAMFDSSYAAAYHPWLGVTRVGGQPVTIVDVPPSAFAAGIVAARERRRGLPWGPANELAACAVRSAEVIGDELHDRLHLLGVNVFRAERDGFRLTAARTLSSDPDYLQLTVRRLMTMLALTLERQSQWLVFEPQTADLRDRLTHLVTQLLRGLHRQGAFAGDSEEESFFVRCDERTNPVSEQAAGRLLAEVGVAPAAPLEYLVLRITQDADGGLAVDRG